MIVCLSFSDHVSKPLTGKSSPYTRNKGYIKPVLHLHTGKLLLEGEFLFWVENQAEQLSTDFEPCFLAVFTAILQLKTPK